MWSDIMEELVIKNINIELRKINATKRRLPKKPTFEVNKLDEEDIEEFGSSIEITLGLKQKSDKTISNFVMQYTIPSYLDLDLEITADFAGMIYFEKPFDFELHSDEKEKKDKLAETAIPMIMKEVDTILKPIYDVMNLQYVPILKNKFSVDYDD